MTAATYYRRRLWVGWGVAAVVAVLLFLVVWAVCRYGEPLRFGLYSGPATVTVMVLAAVVQRVLRCPVCDEPLSLFPVARRCPRCDTSLCSRPPARKKRTEAEGWSVQAPEPPDDAWREPFQQRLRFLGWFWAAAFLGLSVPMLILEQFGSRGRLLMTPAMMGYLHVWRFVPRLQVQCPYCARVLGSPFASHRCEHCGFWHSGTPLTPAPETTDVPADPVSA